MTEENPIDPSELITGTVAGFSELYGQALTEGLIPQDMSLTEFLETTRANRENLVSGMTHHFRVGAKDEGK